MARRILDESARSIDLEAFRPERHRLVEADVAPDDGRLANHDARPVVDEKSFADARARMNVDTRLRMRDLRDDAGDHRHAEIIERVRRPVTDDSGEARKTEDDFVDAFGGRIAF